MSYIRKSDFEIFVKVPKEYVGDKDSHDFFECEELMAPIISTLNRKGYKTKSSRSGHVGLNIDGECLVSESNTMPDDELKDFFADTMGSFGQIDIQRVDSGRRMITLINQADPVARITFEGDFNFDAPGRWYKEDSSIKYRFDNIDGYGFFKERAEVLEQLYAWVIDLPENK